MNTLLIGIIIFVIVYLFLNWFARTSSKKIATTIKKIAVYFSLILAALLTFAGKYIFSLPFLLVILSGLKIKGLTVLQMMQLWRLIQFLKNSGAKCNTSNQTVKKQMSRPYQMCVGALLRRQNSSEIKL